MGAGTSTECSELLPYEMCIENTSRSIRGWRSGSRDNEYSLHTQTSLAISQMKIENAFITSPGTDRNRLLSAPLPRPVSHTGEDKPRLGRAGNCLSYIYSNAPILYMGKLRLGGMDLPDIKE